MTFKNILMLCYLIGLGVCLIWIPETRTFDRVRITNYDFVWNADPSWVNYLKVFYESVLWTWVTACIWFCQSVIQAAKVKKP
jgi:hypothetical protein